MLAPSEPEVSRQIVTSIKRRKQSISGDGLAEPGLTIEKVFLYTFFIISSYTYTQLRGLTSALKTANYFCRAEANRQRCREVPSRDATLRVLPALPPGAVRPENPTCLP